MIHTSRAKRTAARPRDCSFIHRSLPLFLALLLSGCPNWVELSRGPANVPPVAKAGADQSVAVGEETVLNGNQSEDADGRLVGYEWDFGDGSAHGTLGRESHVYYAAGTYLVELAVTDDDGEVSVDSAAVHVTVSPVANAGPDKVGSITTPVSLDGAMSSDSDGGIVSYDWDFGDGSVHGSGVSVTHVFGSKITYTVVLTVTDDDGESNQDTALVTIGNRAPVANAGADQYGSGRVDTNFEGGGSVDADGSLVFYEWNFGDGTPLASGVSVTHIYGMGGTYIAELTVTDNDGDTDTDIATISIAQVPQNVPPEALAGPDLVAVPGQPVNLDGSLSSDADGSIVSYEWNFADGTPLQYGVSVSHVYATVGSYLVVLTVRDDDGEVATDELTVVVN